MVKAGAKEELAGGGLLPLKTGNSAGTHPGCVQMFLAPATGRL
jgi:hypothetical protein